MQTGVFGQVALPSPFRWRHGAQYTSTSTAACSAAFATSSNFRSFVSGSLSFADTAGTDSRKPELHLSTSRRKFPVKILVAANPNPHPNVAFKPLGHRAVIPAHAHGPEARIAAQSFQLQRRMSGVLTEFPVSCAGSVPDSDGEGAISLPESSGVPCDFTSACRSRRSESQESALDWP